VRLLLVVDPKRARTHVQVGPHARLDIGLSRLTDLPSANSTMSSSSRDVRWISESHVDAFHICLLYRQDEMSNPTPSVTTKDAPGTPLPADNPVERRSWIVGITSLVFIVLQSACTAVMAISGVRVIIGLGALAAAAGLHRPASGFHADAIRIPMMILAVGGSIVNLYVIWRIRSLRSRASSQWRAQPVSAKTIRAERFQIALALMTLILVAAEYITHLIVHNA